VTSGALVAPPRGISGSNRGLAQSLMPRRAALADRPAATILALCHPGAPVPWHPPDIPIRARWVLTAAALRCFVVACLLAIVAPGARAESYPKHTVTLVVPVAAGDAADIAGRMMAEELSLLLNVPFVVVNRPGAGAVLGAGEVARARKDGYTILLTVNSALTFRPVLDPRTVPYDIARDLTPLGLATRTPAVLAVRKDAPFADFAQMVVFAKRNPGKVRIGTAGVGSSGHIAVETINALTGAGITMVPYTGASPAVTALAGGFIEGVVVSLGALTGPLRSGAMRGVVASSRSPEFPQVPTLVDLGYPQDLLGVWMAFFAPSGVPVEVTATLVPAIAKVVGNPAIAARLAPLGMIQDYRSPGALAAEMRSEYRQVETVARKAGLIQ
jgi:tripartite-type tricarboxylate transporter receptor subunit TctC